jgi:hypothetical protein
VLGLRCSVVLETGSTRYICLVGFKFVRGFQKRWDLGDDEKVGHNVTFGVKGRGRIWIGKFIVDICDFMHWFFFFFVWGFV